LQTGRACALAERARHNLRQTNPHNVSFAQASAEQLPYLEASFDVAISNGVFNLVFDKAEALREVWRVLKPSGRLVMADQVLIIKPPADPRELLESWARWQGGAIPGEDFPAMLKETGFAQTELVAPTGFNSSPVTQGGLFRAVRSVSVAKVQLHQVLAQLSTVGYKFAER